MKRLTDWLHRIFHKPRPFSPFAVHHARGWRAFNRWCEWADIDPDWLRDEIEEYQVLDPHFMNLGQPGKCPLCGAERAIMDRDHWWPCIAASYRTDPMTAANVYDAYRAYQDEMDEVIEKRRQRNDRAVERLRERGYSDHEIELMGWTIDDTDDNPPFVFA
jgi:hypothetical protein